MPISLNGTPYTQDFNTLAATGTSSLLPNGWAFAETGTNANALYNTGTGSSNAGDTYSFGAAASTERAFGGLQSSSLVPIIGASFSNDTGLTLTQLLLAYTGEQWRLGASGRTDRLDFQYSLDATSLATGTWVDVDGLDFNAPISTGTVGALDGNAAANRTGVSSTLTGLSIAPGATIWLRWTDFNAAGADDGLAVDDFSITTTGSSTPAVNLSVSTHAASESAGTVVIVTATSGAVVAANETVQLAVSGIGITDGDYYLSATSITIPAGQNSGSVTFIVADDAVNEGAETARLTISNPSAGITLGATVNQDVVIANNSASFLTRVGSATSATPSAVPAFDPGSDRLFVAAGSTVNIYQTSTTGSLTPAGSLSPGFTAAAGKTVAPNSVAIRDGLVAVSYEIRDSATNAQDNGRVSFYHAADGSFIGSLPVGAKPGMLTFTPDGSKLLVANEGAPNSYGQASSLDPEGSVSIIDLVLATVHSAGFGAFNSQAAALKAAGVRLFGPGASVAQDLEPQTITFTPDGTLAIVTLQENNAAAVVDIASATVTAVIALGTKNFNLPGNAFDASDRDGGIHLSNWPVAGLYQPDAVVNFSVGGQTWYITANEGASRNLTGYSDEVRVGSASYVLDPTLFPNSATLKLDANLGRLVVSNAGGDTDADGDVDRIDVFGGRSFTVWDSTGTPVYDSGDQLERISATRSPPLFNSDGTAAGFDTRSDDKGPEPEAIAIGVVSGRTYAFIGLASVGDVMVYDVTNPRAPEFVQYINTPADRGIQGLAFVAAADSPTGKPLLITANAASNTVAVFEIAAPLRIHDIQGAAHISPLLANASATAAVQNIHGIVTAVASNGFYMQDPVPDNNPATSEGIFVFTSTAPGRTVGEAVIVSGTVSEFRPAANNLTVTEIGNNAAVQPLVVGPWIGAPPVTITPVIIGVDRTPPTQIINDDFTVPGNVETGGDFDPEHEGIDFYESLEGMLVQIDHPVAVSPTLTSGTSEAIWVLANDGAGATGRTERGGIGVSLGDFNPERLQIDDLINSTVMPQVDVGARLGTAVGVVSYGGGDYEILVANAPSVVAPSALAREVTPLVAGDTQLTVATFNVQNLDPGDGAAKFNALAAAIVASLRQPDILSLEEVQDNSGPTNDGVVDANITFETLIAAIVAAGGPRYEYRQINPVNNQDGGEPGGNIRVGYLFNPARVGFVESSLQRLTDTDLSNGDAFNNSRKPLVGTFTFNGENVTLIGNHFISKGGDQPLFGPTQPPVLSSETQRVEQATIVKTFVAGLLAANPATKIVVLGDLNDFQFSNPLTILKSGGLADLIEDLPANQRYTYNFEGNAQAIDHILVAPALHADGSTLDVVHINSEFGTQVSDHDPLVARLHIERAGLVINGTAGRDVLVGTAGADTLTGGPGRDLMTGGAGGDKFVYTSVIDAGDQITDFDVNADKLVVSALLASVGYTGIDPVGAGYFGLVNSNGHAIITFDPDGSAGPGLAQPLVELIGVAPELVTPAILLF